LEFELRQYPCLSKDIGVLGTTRKGVSEVELPPEASQPLGKIMCKSLDRYALNSYFISGLGTWTESVDREVDSTVQRKMISHFSIMMAIQGSSVLISRSRA
jgi:hypothetical protein